jgi:hypothetical protein
MSWDADAFSDAVHAVELEANYGRGPVGWVYFIVCIDSGRCKIGFTKHDVEKRIKSLQTGSASELTLIAKHPGSIDTERALHERFAMDRIQGEWFNVSDELRAYIVATVLAMSELTITHGKRLEPWMIIGMKMALERMSSWPESLLDALEVA